MERVCVCVYESFGAFALPMNNALPHQCFETKPNHRHVSPASIASYSHDSRTGVVVNVSESVCSSPHLHLST